MFYQAWLHQNHRGATLGSLVFSLVLGTAEMLFSDFQVICTQISVVMKSISLHSSGAKHELARPGAPWLLNYLPVWESHCSLRELKRRFTGSWKTGQLRAMLCTPGSTLRDIASMRKRQLVSEKGVSYDVMIHLCEHFFFPIERNRLIRMKNKERKFHMVTG